MGSAGTISVSRASTSFTHTITYLYGTKSGTICTKSSSTSVSWTPPLDLAHMVPNATSGVGTLYCDTYNGNTKIGSKSISFTCNVPASVKPSCSISSLTNTNSTFGCYAKLLSGVKVKPSAFDITLSDKKSHHFSLEVADQLKISKLNDRANAGITVLPYHADGESCKFYTKDEVVALNTAMENCIEFQTTYFNSLRDYIESMTDINDVCAVEYGVDIPEAYQSEVLKMLYSQANAEA